MNKEKKKFVKKIGTAMKQIKEGKGLTKEQVFGKKKNCKEPEHTWLDFKDKKASLCLNCVCKKAREEAKKEVFSDIDGLIDIDHPVNKVYLKIKEKHLGEKNE